MVCIYCGGSTQVSNSRLQKRNNAVWRRRCCVQCAAIFTTLEQADLASGIMIKDRDDKLQPFVRDQLLVSIYEACKHRPKALTDALALTQTIISDIMTQVSPEGVIDHTQVTIQAHAVLERFDVVAATVYKAYHA